MSLKSLHTRKSRRANSLRVMVLDEQEITFDILNKVALIILITRKLIKISLLDFLIFQEHSLSHEMFMCLCYMLF